MPIAVSKNPPSFRSIAVFFVSMDAKAMPGCGYLGSGESVNGNVMLALRNFVIRFVVRCIWRRLV